VIKVVIVALLAAVAITVAALLVRVRRKARRAAAPERPEAEISFGAPAAPAAPSVRRRVYRVLAGWAGVDVGEVPPDTKRTPDLWRQGGTNPQLSDGHLADLVDRLKQEFPGAQLNLRPADLRDGGLATIDKLVRHVERRTA
jgi:hypothetical protein